jgi:hypothetical protein
LREGAADASRHDQSLLGLVLPLPLGLPGSLRLRVALRIGLVLVRPQRVRLEALVACGARVGADVDRLGVVTVHDHREVRADSPMGDRSEADRLTVHGLGFGVDEVLDRLLLAGPAKPSGLSMTRTPGFSKSRLATDMTE